MTLQKLQEKNRALKAHQRILKSKIALAKFVRWIKIDMKLKQLRKELYGTN